MKEDKNFEPNKNSLCSKYSVHSTQKARYLKHNHGSGSIYQRTTTRTGKERTLY